MVVHCAKALFAPGSQRLRLKWQQLTTTPVHSLFFPCFKPLLVAFFVLFPQTACALLCDGYNGDPLLKGPKISAKRVTKRPCKTTGWQILNE